MRVNRKANVSTSPLFWLMQQCHTDILKTATINNNNNNNNNNNKGHTRRDREGPERKLRYRSTRSLITALDWGGWST